MFALVFTTRYLDLATNFVSPYNTVMKIFFLITTYTTVGLIFTKFKQTYDRNQDTFRIEFLIVPCAGLAVLVNHSMTPLEASLICSKRLHGSAKWNPMSGRLADKHVY